MQSRLPTAVEPHRSAQCGGRPALPTRRRRRAAGGAPVTARALALPYNESQPHQILALLWRHAAMVALSASALLPVLRPPAAWAAAPQLGGGGNGAPPSGGVGGGGGGSGGGGGDGWQLARRPPQEAFQVAAANKPILLTLVSFAVTRKAYGKITKLFNRDYEAATGRTVRFRLSFGGSGSQARAVIDGMPADVVALALPLDIIKIAEAGLVRDDWAKQFPNDSVVAESVCAIVVRKGNPKNIRGWDDLARDDVSVITANPKTAGVARWIFFALWGVKLGKGKRAATQYVTKVFDQVLVQPRDAREASDVFYRQGMGDVLLTYENEAIFTNLVVPEKDRLPFIVPDQNIRIQCPLALVDYNLANSPPELRHAATAFCNFLYTKEAQREFAACGFRTPYKDLSEEFGLQPVKGLWTVEKRLGGWKAVQTEFFEDTGICSEVLRDVGARKLVARMANWAECGGHGTAPRSGSQDSSPSKPLPPKTPAPSQLEAAAPVPSAQSALTHLLQQQGASGEAAHNSGASAAADARLQQPWGHATSGAVLAAIVHGGSAGEDGEEEAMLLFNAPAAAGGVDPQLLVHSPDSSLDGGEGFLQTAAAAAAGGSSPAVQQQQQHESAGDGDGERTPRASSALRGMAGGVDLLSPSADPGFCLADLLQGPAPPPPRVPDTARSPGSSPAFLPEDLPHLPHLDEGSLSGLSPRRSLHLPGCSPLRLTGLRDPTHLPCMPPAPVPRLPLMPPGMPPTQLRGHLPSHLPSLPILPRPLSGHPPPALPAPYSSTLRRPLVQPLGRGLPMPGALKGPGLLLRPSGPLMPHQGMQGMRPLLAGLPRPAPGPLMHSSGGGPTTMVPMPVPAGSSPVPAQWLGTAEDEFLTAEGVRTAFAAVPAPTPTQQLQQQQQQPAPTAAGASKGTPFQQQTWQPPPGGRGSQPAAREAAAGGAAVPVQAAASIRAPAAAAAYAAIKIEAAAGAAAAAAAILAAPSAAPRPAAAAAGVLRPGPQLPAQHPQLAAGWGVLRRAPGGDPMQSPAFRAFLAMLRGSSTEFEAGGRVLRLRQFLRADVRPRVLDAVLDALEANTRVEALYIQNFEQGFLDEQLDRLVCLLRRRRIWALNLGENFNTTQPAWQRFCEALPGTAVAHLFVSEQHLAGSCLKVRMRDAIRANRSAAPPRDPEVVVHVGNMWWNPRLPPSAGTYSPRGSNAAACAAAAAGVAAVVTVPLPAAASRESLSGGSAPAGVGSAGRSRSAPTSAGAATSGDGSAAAAASGPSTTPPPAAAGVVAPGGAEPASQQQQGYSLRLAPKRRQGYNETEYFTGSPLAKRGPGVSAFGTAASQSAAAAAAAAGVAAGVAAPQAPVLPMDTDRAGNGAHAGADAGPDGAAGGRSGRRASRPSAALLLQQAGSVSSDGEEVHGGELDESYDQEDYEQEEEEEEDEEDEEDAIYLPFKSGLLVSSDPCAAPTRASRRIQHRSAHATGGRLRPDSDLHTSDSSKGHQSPPRSATAPRRGRTLHQTAASAAAASQRAAAARARSAAVAAAQPAPTAAGGSTRIGGLPRAAATAAKRTVQSAAQRIRSSSGRQSSGELKGRPSFAELMESGFMQPGSYRFTVGMQDIHAALEGDGTILYAGARYRAISKFALVVLRERNPSRQSCDGWKEVTWNGEKLDVLRARFQSHQRKAAARKTGTAAAGAVRAIGM
ncbi:hypothetical protein D9Q98_000316 [Chlorella vulgaris]|uniref:RAMA domain-containing protein n=1 Tax=Chlorella vulgaris TaxID=3077 RepID=A0A9D4TXW7_CHLVU|nr:hypothetical protein D9Q98_000316 [Chlorella vulgaris]